MKHKVLVVDDDVCIHDSFESIFSNDQFNLQFFKKPELALAALKKDPFSYAVAFVDYQYKGEDGELKHLGHLLVKEFKKLNPALKTIIMSGDESESAAQEWVSAKADKIMYKPLKPPLVRALTQSAIEAFDRNFGDLSEIEASKSLLSMKNEIKKAGLIGVSPNLGSIAKLINKCAQTDETFLILGETGVGKEVIAKAIKNKSQRSNKPMVSVNCAGITKDLFKSELFGHKKGAFTGAHQDKKGKFQQANGGTLFLDEIHHLTLSQQASLLRVIQERKVCRVGGDEEVDIDVRLIVAAKDNLLELTESGEFMPDLYYRISEALTVEVKPLRERPDDIVPLTSHFQNEFGQAKNINKRFTTDAIEAMHGYKWPGNVRELRSLVKKLYLKVEGRVIDKPQVELEFIESGKNYENPDKVITKMTDLEEKHKNEKIKNILLALEQTGDNKTQAADLLGIKRTSLSTLLRTNGLLNLKKEKKSNLIKLLLGKS